ncbi:hypothetical protein Si133o_01331 [Streptococcus infantarius subsp. infantarius]|nr:hypothetical protein [Streptococcus infantarius subsp. infantarius]MCO4470210.1 hypothetical protein [Streptococcus infantarius subsp. infantarius]MCO4474754.1 hypothetical protein [Streptococcus infantarius subsp. infantarius]MCO4475598.1 hypothetical protein [Streptococcus infantarius subsp. infantarius]MCO4478229.1 hypothetical protein [Streptococcus infantarius subsp. infantarius]
MATLRVSCTMKVLFFIHRTFDEYLPNLEMKVSKKVLLNLARLFNMSTYSELELFELS